MEFQLRDNKIYFMRGGERGVIGACEEGCIRFQATASPDETMAISPNCHDPAHFFRTRIHK